MCRACGAAYLDTITALRSRSLRNHDVSSRVRLTKTPERYLENRNSRRELTYEAVLASGRTSWTVGERVRIYRTRTGNGGVVGDPDDHRLDDARDYDVEHYLRVLRDTFAARLVRAFTADDYAAVFADPGQPSLFAASPGPVRPVLTVLHSQVRPQPPAAEGCH